tara:strand:+ start:1956 stop:2402 length:447 start_codon:yes stop_codon:yes gene_type:complete
MKKIVFSVLILFSFACKDYPKNTSPLHEIYEMRVYYTYEGRFDNILSRFENHTVKLFEKHGFTNVGYWTTDKKDSVSFADEFIFENGGKPALVYIVSFQNMDIRNKSWDKFINDPEWKKVYEESILDGPIVEKIEQVFLNPTNFSKLK